MPLCGVVHVSHRKVACPVPPQRGERQQRETQHDEGKRTQATPKPNKNPNARTETKTPPRARGRFPLIKRCFLCASETIKKSKPDCELTMAKSSG